MNKKKSIKKGGAYAEYSSVKTCISEPDVSQYTNPCKSLTDNQFGFKEIVGYYSGGSKYKKQNGGCGIPKTDCMGNNIPNMSDMTKLPSASEHAWSFRNVYGAQSSTNEVPQKGGKNKKSKNIRIQKSKNIRIKKSKIPQKGGNYFLAVNKPTIGGLARINYQDDSYAQYAKNVNLAPIVKNHNNTVNENVLPKSELITENCMKGGRSKYNKKGGQGNFSHDMNTRKFDCVQPYWNKDCV